MISSVRIRVPARQSTPERRTRAILRRLRFSRFLPPPLEPPSCVKGAMSPGMSLCTYFDHLLAFPPGCSALL